MSRCFETYPNNNFGQNVALFWTKEPTEDKFEEAKTQVRPEDNSCLTQVIT